MGAVRQLFTQERNRTAEKTERAKLQKKNKQSDNFDRFTTLSSSADVIATSPTHTHTHNNTNMISWFRVGLRQEDVSFPTHPLIFDRAL